MISNAVEVIFRVQWGQEISLGVPGGRWGGPGGPRGWKETSRGSHLAIVFVWGVSWWFMRHICLYTLDPDFHCAVRTYGSTRGSTRGPRGPKNNQLCHSVTKSLSMSLSLSSCWSCHVSLSLWTIVRKVTCIYDGSAVLWRRWNQKMSHSLTDMTWSTIGLSCLFFRTFWSSFKIY